MPENHADLPVKIEIEAPMTKSPAAPAAMLVKMAPLARRKKNGTTGMTAPIAKSSIEERAAAQADPLCSVGSMPSSSRERTSSAVFGSASSFVDSAFASSEPSPFAS